MIKPFLLGCLIFASSGLHAQRLKLSVTQGLGFDTKRSTDSLYFANGHNVSQFRVAYTLGRMGFLTNFNYITQRNLNNQTTIDARYPIVDLVSLQSATKTFSSVKTLQTSVGLQLCLPVYRNVVTAHIYAVYGLSFSKSDSIKFEYNGLVRYSNKADNKRQQAWQAGFSLQYVLHPRFCVKWQNEWNQYSISGNGFDIRKAPSTFATMQSKPLFITSLGVQYTF
jgi:hypothetical protein